MGHNSKNIDRKKKLTKEKLDDRKDKQGLNLKPRK